MAETQPALAKDMTSQELLRWYWLRSELTGLARSVGVAAIGSKQELTARLVAYLDGGTPTTVGVRRAAAPTPLAEPLTADTPIPAGQRCTQQLRRYFTDVIGPSFRFDAAMRTFIADGAGQTLSAAVDHWNRTRSQPRSEIGAQFELNRFIRDWHHDHPEGSRTQALRAWGIYRGRPVDARSALPRPATHPSRMRNVLRDG